MRNFLSVKSGRGLSDMLREGRRKRIERGSFGKHDDEEAIEQEEAKEGRRRGDVYGQA